MKLIIQGGNADKQNSFRNPLYLVKVPPGFWYCKIDSLNEILINNLKIVMRTNEPKKVIKVIASHSSTSSPSGFSKGNQAPYVGKSVCHRNQSHCWYPSCGNGTVGKSWTTDLRVPGSKPLDSGRFSVGRC